MRPFRFLLWIGLLLPLACRAGEGRAGRAQASPAPQVAKVRDVESLAFLKVIRCRDGGYSTGFRDRSVWVFGDTVLESPGEDGSRWRSSTWCSTTDLDAADGLADLTEPQDGKGAPGEFLPFTAVEKAYNDVHFRLDVEEAKRTRWALWPGPVVVAPDGKKALVFYGKIFGRTGAFNFDVVGHSIAPWEDLGKRPIRPTLSPGSDDSTLLFPKGDVVLGQGALRKGEWLYAYGCETKGLSWPCIVAKVK
ncbi:MAG: hypothetical protein ACYS47_16290, partial [Planctomycetota bacterium]